MILGSVLACVGLCWGYVGTSGATLLMCSHLLLKYVVLFVGLFRIREATILGHFGFVELCWDIFGHVGTILGSDWAI